MDVDDVVLFVVQGGWVVFRVDAAYQTTIGGGELSILTTEVPAHCPGVTERLAVGVGVGWVGG